MSHDDATWSPTSLPADEPLEPTVTERVERVRELGRGGMGVVWLGVQRQLGREVAVKTLTEAGDPVAWQSLVREARIAARLEHPNIVPVHDLCLDGADQPQLVMKRLQGRPWRELIRHPERLPPEQQADPIRFHLSVLQQVCRAVEYAHAHDVLHRDLKPSNVMVGAFGEVTVLDWGAALSVEHDVSGHQPDVASQSTVVGTPRYMAPEMFRPRRGELGPASDLYLLGGMLFELLTGASHRPDRGTFAEHRDWAKQPPEVPESVPADLRRLLQRVLSTDPAARGTVAAFRQALEDHARAEVAEQARRRVQERIDVLGEAISSGDADEVLRLYGEVRFGLAALDAQGGQAMLEEELLRRMVAFELERGEVGAARLLLAHVPEPPRDLLQHVDEAEVRVRRREERLAQLDRFLDTRTGQVLRGGLGSSLMVVFLGQSFLLDALQLERGYVRQLVADPIRFVFVGFILLVFWRWLRTSQVSRALSALVLFAPLVSMPTVLALWIAGVDPAAVSLVRGGIDAVLTFFAGALVDRRLLPAGVLYLAVVPVVAMVPAWSTWIFMVPTVAIGLSVLWMWKERT